MPDIVIKQEKLPNILFYLVRDNLIFDYATQYCLKHPTIVAPEKFEVTDADYNDFKGIGEESWISSMTSKAKNSENLERGS